VIFYKGSAPAMQDLIGGQIPTAFDTVTVAGPHIKSGKIRALAVTSAKRTKTLPDVPTMQEAGVANYDVASWQALFAPAGTPAAVVTRMNAEIEKIIAMPEVAAKMESLGLEHTPNTPAQFAEFNRNELAKWAKIVKEGNIKIE
jgi:tripartite-type tricarboxylate transporter receptor subunit TctC